MCIAPAPLLIGIDSVRSRHLDAVLEPLLDAPEATLVLGLKAWRRSQALADKGQRWWARQADTAARRSGAKAEVAGGASVLPSAKSSQDPAWSERQAASRPASFILYRIIGNDLYPRHDEGQSLANLEFILQHEPELEGCEKRWIFNRIRQPERLQRLIDLLVAHGYGYDVIPFDADTFADVPWDWGVLPSPGFLASDAYVRSLSHQRQAWELALYRNKNNYLMNNNGARNRALELGRSRGANWILPWDGNCFVTALAWRQLRAAVMERSQARYFHVPMLRIGDNAQLLDPDFAAEPRDEPQLIFARDATEQFSAAFPYGRRPKVELFWRLGLAGPWDAWPDEPWDQPRRPPLKPAPACPQAGWVARLHSGVRDRGDRKVTAVLSQQSRYSARNLAIKASINQALVGSSGLPPSAFQAIWQGSGQAPSDENVVQPHVPRAQQILMGWLSWAERGGEPPSVSHPQLISAFTQLLWSCLVAPEHSRVEHDALLATVAGRWFSSGRTALQPRLRLLRRRQAAGWLAGTAPTIETVVQLAVLSDLLAWGQPTLANGTAGSWLPTVLLWRDALCDHLEGLIDPAWLGSRRLDRQWLQLSLALLQRHRARPAAPVDALLRLLSFQLDLLQSGSGCPDAQLRQLSLGLAEQHRLLDAELVRQLHWQTGQPLIAPLACLSGQAVIPS